MVIVWATHVMRWQTRYRNEGDETKRHPRVAASCHGHIPILDRWSRVISIENLDLHKFPISKTFASLLYARTKTPQNDTPCQRTPDAKTQFARSSLWYTDSLQNSLALRERTAAPPILFSLMGRAGWFAFYTGRLNFFPCRTLATVSDHTSTHRYQGNRLCVVDVEEVRV